MELSSLTYRESARILVRKSIFYSVLSSVIGRSLTRFPVAL